MVVYSINGSELTRQPYKKEINLDPYPKISRWTANLCVKGKTIILLEENYMRTIPDFRVDETFLNKMQKVVTIKSDKVKNIKSPGFLII